MNYLRGSYAELVTSVGTDYTGRNAMRHLTALKIGWPRGIFSQNRRCLLLTCPADGYRDRWVYCGIGQAGDDISWIGLDHETLVPECSPWSIDYE